MISKQFLIVLQYNFIKIQNRRFPCGNLRLKSGKPLGLDSRPDDKVINQESDPTGREHGHGQDYFPEEFELVVLENVKYAPYCGNDTEDVDNCS